MYVFINYCVRTTANYYNLYQFVFVAYAKIIKITTFKPFNLHEIYTYYLHTNRHVYIAVPLSLVFSSISSFAAVIL